MEAKSETYRKFEFVEGDIHRGCHPPLRRIRAIRDFGNVKKGQLGGYIADEACLSHDSNCWVADNARVAAYGVRISGNAQIAENAYIASNTQIFDNARIDGNATVNGASRVCENAHVTDEAWVNGWAFICGDAWIGGNTRVALGAVICGGTYSEGFIDGIRANPKHADPSGKHHPKSTYPDPNPLG